MNSGQSWIHDATYIIVIYIQKLCSFSSNIYFLYQVNLMQALQPFLIAYTHVTICDPEPVSASEPSNLWNLTSQGIAEASRQLQATEFKCKLEFFGIGVTSRH